MRKRCFYKRVSPEITQNIKKENFKNKPVGKKPKREYKKPEGKKSDKNDMNNAVTMNQSRFRINKI